MPTSNDALLIKFRAKNTAYGVTRSTVKALAKELDVNETQVIHMALSKFAADVLPAYEADDGALSATHIKALRQDIEQRLPQGQRLSIETLFK